jgi:hypothetical protein
MVKTKLRQKLDGQKWTFSLQYFSKQAKQSFYFHRKFQILRVILGFVTCTIVIKTINCKVAELEGGPFGP